MDKVMTISESFKTLAQFVKPVLFSENFYGRLRFKCGPAFTILGLLFNG